MVGDVSRPQRGTGRVTSDGRRQLLVYVDPDVIIAIKKAALDRKPRPTTASAIVDEALREWLERHQVDGA